jgi:uncharacterized coiled-coil DUF342 family protein
MSHKREPIRHTCPDIDKFINSIKGELYKEKDLRNMEAGELFDAALGMSNELQACIEYLEEIRKSNDKLRSWGIEEAENLDNAQKELDNLQAEIETLRQCAEAGN